MNIYSTREQIRKIMIKNRQNSSFDYRQQAAQAVMSRISTISIYKYAKNIAGYWPCNGELDVIPILEQAIKYGKTVYLPVVNNQNHTLNFATYMPKQLLKCNRFGIPEPDVLHSDCILPKQLDMVLLPIVAFDIVGNRLGMGGGFYDRSFSFVMHEHYQRTYLLGLAYEYQKISYLKKEFWDISLDAVITEVNIYYF